MTSEGRPRPGERARDAARWVAWSARVLGRGFGSLIGLFAGGGLRAHIRPWMEFDRAEEVPYELIASQGMRAVLFDLENTLVPPGGPFTPEGREILRKVRDAGLGVGVVTNASAGWVPRALRAEGVPFVAPAGKPGKDAFVSACRTLGVRPDEAVYVGDQMITDVLGAQRAGLRAILVRPRYTKEFWSSRFQRAVARGVLRLTRNG